MDETDQNDQSATPELDPAAIIAGLRTLITRIRAALDAIPQEHRPFEIIHQAVVQLPDEEHQKLTGEMLVIVMLIEEFYAAIQGWRTLLNPVADGWEVMNLLSAIEPKKLSTDVMRNLITNINLGDLDALPIGLYRQMSRYMDEQEMAEMAEEQAQRKAKPSPNPSFPSKPLTRPH